MRWIQIVISLVMLIVIINESPGKDRTETGAGEEDESGSSSNNMNNNSNNNGKKKGILLLCL